MAPQAFCCDQIRSPTFENEEYRLGLFIYWEKAGNKGPPTKDETPGLNVPFCVQVSQKPKSIRLFVPTGWGEFSEIDRKLLATPWVPHGVHRKTYQVTVYERRVKSSTLPPTTSTSFNTKVPDQNGCGHPSSSTTIKEPTNMAGEPDASTNPPAANDHTEPLVGTDTKYNLENISSLANMPAGQYVLDLINWARNTVPLTKVSLPTEAEILKKYLFHDLRKLTESVEENIFLWMLLSTSYPAVKFLMSCSPSNVYTKEDRAKILEATAAAVNAVYCLVIGQHESQDSNPDFIDVFEEICRQHPDDRYLTSLVNRAIERLRQVIEAEEDEQSKAGLTEREMYPLANEDDTYDHCDLSISDQEAE
ncbi:hypothetical protein PENSOL_c039G00980 [Penicillium solitum]|uniref:Uncharacterized protein n=1 Tax=Penicillium solitum TaxID=60172 RepID=A0A1V6QUM3_9EURO|nr:uncharacterized protein PENSOL_c039G00980 [Penicillium solitum]OQD92626.1 hypothetical protein PENSOL_c039G00980 [Penicillium solitum]